MSNHNNIVSQVFKKFEREARDRRTGVSQSIVRSPGQKYVQRELQVMYGITSEEETRTRIQDLLRIYSGSLPRIVQRQLNEIRRFGLTDDSLLSRLIQINNQYGISDMRSNVMKETKNGKILSMVVCSVAFTQEE